MFNIIFSDEYQVAPGLLVRMRQHAGLSQRDIAAQLGRSQAHIYKIEAGQRPIEIVEFCRYVRALGGDPLAALQDLIAQWDRLGCGYAVGRKASPNPEACSQ